MKQLVLAFVDQTGMRLTGRFKDRYCLEPETESIPEAKACAWSDYSEPRLEQLKVYMTRESSSLIGWDSLFCRTVSQTSCHGLGADLIVR
jgi:hypothetical protein